MTHLIPFFQRLMHRLYLPTPDFVSVVSALLLVGLFQVPALLGAYQYYYTDNLNYNLSTGPWTINGTVTDTPGGLMATTNGGGSLISTLAIPDGTSDYEVNSFLTLVNSSGRYTHYLRATSNAKLGEPGYTSSTGTFYAVDLKNVSISGGGISGSATLVVQKRVNNSQYLLASASVAIHNGMLLHSVMIGYRILVYLDNFLIVDLTDTAISTGKPGVGARWTQGENRLANANFGPADRQAPFAVDSSSVATAVFPNSVDMQWEGAADDANGIGVAGYKLYRNNVFVTDLYSSAYTDATLSPSQTYQYKLYSFDYHKNLSSSYAVFSVTTPPTGSVDPRRVGIRPTGTYWGAGTGQIDLLSGNLNYSTPLLRAVGRGGWGSTFALSYNSQLWRQNNNVTWKLGHDTGFGFGWRLQAGSLTPYWSDDDTLHHYTFTDSTGAEYRLDVNNGNIWTSRESIYLTYDTANRRLYFPDGSLWAFESLSSGTEEDAGTRYPTLMQDTNGNRIILRYLAGSGVLWTNSSSRILEIEDVRAQLDSSSGRRWSYRFDYNSSKHLSGVVNSIGTTETYNFSYQTCSTLQSPWNSQTFGETQLLSQVTVSGSNLSHGFSYSSSPASAELNQINLPNGGFYGWTYATYTNAGGHLVREVLNQTVSPGGTGQDMTYTLTHDAGDSGRMVHAKTVLDGPGGSARKVWTFLSDGAPSWQVGLNSRFEQQVSSSDSTVLRREDFTWAQDTANNPFIASVLTTLNPGAGLQKQSKTEQLVDSQGNVTWTKLYDYDSLSTPAKIYNYTYLTNTNYTNRYIRNRLLTATISNGSGGGTVTLVSNTYDGGSLTDRTFLRQHDTANYGASFIYRGNITTSSSPGTTRNMAYDITGAAVSANDGQGHTVSITADSGKNYAVPSIITPNSQSNLATSYSYANSLAVTSVTVPNNATGTTTYDVFGRPSVTHSPHGADTTYAYTYNPTTVKATTNGKWQRTTVDGLGRTTTIETGDSSGSKTVVTHQYASCGCTPLGKVWKTSQTYAAGGTPSAWTIYDYDSLGRTTQVTLPDGSFVTYLYEGNKTKVTDPAGKSKEYYSDAFGNLLRVVEPAPQGSGTVETTYAYDLLGHLTQVNMTRGSTTQVRTFTYDATTQRLLSMTHPESGTTSFTYNNDGTVLRRTDAKIQKIQYTYDSYQRPAMIQRFLSSGSEDPLQRVTFTYDTATNGWGRVGQINWQTGGGMQFATTMPTLPPDWPRVRK